MLLKMNERVYLELTNLKRQSARLEMKASKAKSQAVKFRDWSIAAHQNVGLQKKTNQQNMKNIKDIFNNHANVIVAQSIKAKTMEGGN